MTRMDNAAAVQVGLALLLGLLVVSSSLLVLGIVVVAIRHAHRIGRRVDDLTSAIDGERGALRERLPAARTAIREAGARVADLERRLATQEGE